ncbi:MAG: response regulator [Pseudomonadota bacterium]
MIAEEDFLAELNANLAEGDKVKANLVAANLAGQSEKLQSDVLDVLRRWDTDLAVPVLGTMLDLTIGSLAISRTTIAGVAAEKIIESPKAIDDLSEDAQIHVVTVIGENGDERGLKPLRRLLIAEPESVNLRFTVYEALSKLPMRAGGYVLASGLEDKEISVRVAAARAVEKNLSDTLTDGIKNMLANPEPVPQELVAALCQGGSIETIKALLPDDRFVKLLAEFAEKNPDPEFLSQLRKPLAKANRHALLSLVDSFLEAQANVKGPLIYVVDDSHTVLRMYRAALGTLACSIRAFENPFEAIEWAEKEPPDLVFTDLNMPEIDGIELASTLRSNASLPDFPIIMVTTQAQGADLERAFNSGVDDYIQKPFKAESLVEKIAEFTEYDLNS